MKEKLDPAVIKKSLRRQGFSDMIKDFDHRVDLGARTATKEGRREEIRSWFKESFIRVHAECGEIADVIWDKDWRKFYFKNDEHSVMFKLRFL